MKPLILPLTFLFVAQVFAQTPTGNAPPALQVLSQQGPNLSSWVLAPIDRSIPDAIRQNVTFLREDLVDEGKTKPQASLEAYRVAHQFCSSLIAVLDEREKMLLKAGYRAVQANVVTPATNQALEARRNYLMSWPQYQREVQQRNDLLRVGEAADRRKVELALQDLKLEWAKRAEPLRTSLDALYIKLRAALRDSGMTTNTFDGAQGGSPANVPAMPVLPPPTVTPTVPVSPQGTFTNSLGMKFVPVPDTSVLFCIHEVRHSDYAAYAVETQGVDSQWWNQTHDGFAIKKRNGDHPVANVSWEDARKFCAWLSQKEGRRYRLPTDEEWSIAVGLGRAEQRPKGTTPAMLSEKENTEFPWGGDYPPKTKDQAGNYRDVSRKDNALKGYDDGYPTTAPVMNYKPNKFGLHDMGGNVWEWCEDWYDDEQEQRVLRGGSWWNSPRGPLLSSYRVRLAPDERHYDFGFRVVLVSAGNGHANISNTIRKDPTANVPAMPVLPPPTVRPPAQAAPQGTFTNSLGMKFVPVPGTSVLMCIHETRNADYAAYAAEQADVDGTWRKEAQPGKEQHPVTRVNHNDAKNFCAWLSRKEGQNYRIPTDSEWSLAVGLGVETRGSPEEKDSNGPRDAYPWGNYYPPKPQDGNFGLPGNPDGYEGTSPVMSFQPNNLGIYDLGGNADEWCQESYGGNDNIRILRGSSFWANKASTMRSAGRSHDPAVSRHDNIHGIRCVVEVDGG